MRGVVPRASCSASSSRSSLAVVDHDPSRCGCSASGGGGARRCSPASIGWGARGRPGARPVRLGLGCRRARRCTSSPSASRPRWRSRSRSTCSPGPARWRSASAPGSSSRRDRAGGAPAHRASSAATASSSGSPGARASARSDRPTRGRSDVDGSEGVRLRRVLEEAGGVYVKLGQIAATRVDLLPARGVRRARAAAEPGRARAREIECGRVLEAELGADVEQVFAEFDWEPLAAASIGQTYRARLQIGRGGRREGAAARHRGRDGARPRRARARSPTSPSGAPRFGQGVRSGEVLDQFAAEPARRARLPARGRRDGGDGGARSVRRPTSGSRRSTASSAPAGSSSRSASKGFTVADADEARTRRRSTADALAERAAALDARPGAAASASSTPTRTPGTSSSSATARSGSSTSARSAGSTRSSKRRRRHARRARPPRRQPCSATASSGSPTSASTSPRAAGAGPRPADGRPRARQRCRRPDACCRTWSRMIAAVRHPAARRPRRCSRGRLSRSTARCGSSRPACRWSPRRPSSMASTEAPIDPRHHGPRRADGRRSRTCAACPTASTASSRSRAAATCASAA